MLKLFLIPLSLSIAIKYFLNVDLITFLIYSLAMFIVNFAVYYFYQRIYEEASCVYDTHLFNLIAHGDPTPFKQYVNEKYNGNMEKLERVYYYVKCKLKK